LVVKIDAITATKENAIRTVTGLERSHAIAAGVIAIQINAAGSNTAVNIARVSRQVI
jgi:hypothetical protein